MDIILKFIKKYDYNLKKSINHTIDKIIEHKQFTQFQKVAYINEILNYTGNTLKIPMDYAYIINETNLRSMAQTENQNFLELVKLIEATHSTIRTFYGETIYNRFLDYQFDQQQKQTWLHFATQNNMIDFVKLLIALDEKHTQWFFKENKSYTPNKSIINDKDIYGRTALFYACENKNIEIQLLLLRAGADDSIPDWLGKKPIVNHDIINIFKLEQEKKNKNACLVQ
jgi:ankyrin repeat protein